MNNDDVFVYFLNNVMYINVTNLCTNECVFCIRNLSDTVSGKNLWLNNKTVTAEEVIEAIKNGKPEIRKEIVFCGYGEPLIKKELVKEIAKFIKENYPDKPVRINTNGQANLIHKKNIVPELIGLIDGISVSLNADTPDLYQELTKSKFDKDLAFNAVKEFIKECSIHGIKVDASIVVGFENYNVDVDKCEKLAKSLGAQLKVREWLESGYE